MTLAQNAVYQQSPTILTRHPLPAYFVLAFAISWLGALAVVAPSLLRSQPVSKFSGILMFPVMMLGPSLAGIAMTAAVDGREGLRSLWSRMRYIRVPVRWYAALLIPPAIIFLVLSSLETFVSPVYSPNHFFLGISFGLVAGFFEEIGWMGFAFPRMRRPDNALAPAALLGVLWAIWHMPAVDHLGTATPHGPYWLRYFLAFAAAMTAMRVLIAWVYTNTRSVGMAQLLHASSTGALVALSPPRVMAGQEVSWYLVYAAALWIAVAVIVTIFGKKLRASL